MNDKGLFFGAAATEIVKVSQRGDKKKIDWEKLPDLILRKCATVQEAMKLLEPYDIGLVEGQLLFADKTRDSFILQAGDITIRKRGRFQVMTNVFSSWAESDKMADPRYKLVVGMLGKQDNISVGAARGVLRAAAVKETQYSIVFDRIRSYRR